MRRSICGTARGSPRGSWSPTSRRHSPSTGCSRAPRSASTYARSARSISPTSLASPAEVRVRDVAVCEACETKDCIAGRHEIDPRTGEPRLVQNGCELWLFQPRKAGNMDCTFCLDCVQACPYDNVGIVARWPGAELVGDPMRSGIGRFTDRPDLLALAMVVVFGAFVNAAGMIGPMVRLQDGTRGNTRHRERAGDVDGLPRRGPGGRSRAPPLPDDGRQPPTRPHLPTRPGGPPPDGLRAGAARVRHVARPLRLPLPRGRAQPRADPPQGRHRRGDRRRRARLDHGGHRPCRVAAPARAGGAGGRSCWGR